MRGLRSAAVVAVILFALPVVSVYAAGGYRIGVPILGTTGAPALGAPGYFSGAISVLYADGTPVVLGYNKLSLNLCSTSCETVTATLKQTSPGAYSYTFVPPSTLSATVTIYVVSGSLSDDNGRIFPSVDTQIGSFSIPSSSTSSTPLPETAASANPTQVTPQSPESTQVTKQAVAAAEPKQQSPVMPLLVALNALAVVGVGLVIYPGRRA